MQVYTVVSMEILEITNQPCDVFRFRYKCENEGHGQLKGSLPDEPTNKKTNFPTVKFKFSDRYPSSEGIQIKASLYTIENPPRPHIVQLIGKTCVNGECFETVSKDGIAVFRGLEIRTKKKHEVIQMLVDKKRETLELAGEQYDTEKIQKEATDEYNSLDIDMDRAVIRFEAFHRGRSISKKVFSSRILHKKAAPSDLRILRTSHYTGSWEGGDEVILLCAKFKKAENDEIEVQFYEEDENGEVIWSGKGSFDPVDDIYYQNAIVFRTPKYPHISGGKVKMKLYRTSDEQSSEPVPFEYIPGEIDSFFSSKKRKLQQFSESKVNCFTPSCSATVSRMEDDSNLIGGPPIEVNGNYQTFPDFEMNANQEVVASTSRNIESPQLDVSGNNPTLLESTFGQEVFDNTSYLTERTQEGRTERVLLDDDSLIDKYFDDILDDILDWEISMCNSHYNITSKWPSSPEDLGINEQSSKIMTDAPNSYVEDEGIGNMQRKASSLSKNGIEKMPLYKKSYGARTTKTSGYINGTSKTSLKPTQEVLEESGLCSSMKQLSIDKELVDEHNFSMNLPISVDAPSRGKLENLEENVCSKSEAKVNKNFEHFKEGINHIMKNQREHIYLQYVLKLMTVEDEDGNTFLHSAINKQNKNVNLIAMLLKICPEFVNKQNKYGETPLHLATKTDAYKVVFLLLSNGGNSSIVDAKGNNCFHIASKFNFTNSMKILLLSSIKSGRPMPSIDEINYDGCAPLHLSVLNSSGECLQLLLQAGANVNIKDGKSGSSVLNLALKQQPAFLHTLLYHPGIDLLNQDFKGDTFVRILSTLKGVPVPRFDDSEHLVNWAVKTLDLPSIDSCECTSTSSDSGCSYEDSDDDETAIVQTPIVNNVERNSLNKECEEQVCSYLDTKSHWRKLGTLIDIEEKTLNGLELLSKTSSPSKVILRKVKNLYPNCNKQTLINILIEADLEEAVKLLK